MEAMFISRPRMRGAVFVCALLCLGAVEPIWGRVMDLPAAEWVDFAVPATNARTIAIDPQNGVLVPSERPRGRLRHYDQDANLLGQVYVEADSADSVAADASGGVWVTCGTTIRRYAVFGTEQTTAVEAGSAGAGPGQYGRVRAMAVDGAGCLLVADTGQGRILRYAPDGAFVESWGGQEPFELSRGSWSLTGLAVDALGQVYVVDQMRARVVVFDAHGKGVRVFGGGVCPKPTGVAVSPAGYAFVGDCQARAVFVFGPDGQCLGSLGGTLPNGAVLKYPWGMAIDRRGDLWVADAQGDTAYRFAAARLIRALRGPAESAPVTVPAATTVRAVEVAIPDAPPGAGMRPVLLPLCQVRDGLRAAGVTASELFALESVTPSVWRGTAEIPTQRVDLRGDGPGMEDDLLAFQIPAAPGSGVRVSVRLGGAVAGAAAVPSGQVSVARDEATDTLTLRNDRYAWSLSTRHGWVTAVAAAGASEPLLSGALEALQPSPPPPNAPPQYRSRVICAGPLLAGVELFSLGQEGELRMTRRTLWLWQGEAGLREWLETSGTFCLVHAVSPADQGVRETASGAFVPEEPLAASLAVGPLLLVTAFDETAVDTDGYAVQRVASRNLPHQRLASTWETRPRDGGVEQIITLYGNRLQRLRWLVGLVPQGADAAAQVWRQANLPVLAGAAPTPARSEVASLPAAGQFRAVTQPPMPLCDFYNVEAAFPDLSGLLVPDIDQRGFLQARGNRLVYENGDVLTTFWGGTTEWTSFKDLCVDGRGGWPPVGKRGVEHIVKWISINGWDFMRWHHHDHPSITWIADEATSTIRPQALDVFHYFLYLCHERGIRVSFDSLLIARPFERILPDLPCCYGTWDRGSPCNLVPLFDARAIQLQKDFATNLLTSYNPYRNRRVVDDPTLAIVSIENERTYLSAAGAEINRWDRLPELYRAELTGLWNQFLRETYGDRDGLNRAWAADPLKADEDPARNGVSLPALGDMPPPLEKRPRPRISSGFEFVYWLHKKYLGTMYGHLRGLGFKGIIMSNGDQAMLAMRRAAAETLDALATAGYADRMALAPYMGPAALAVADKPIINREWGPQNDVPNSWWCVLPYVISAKYLDQPYSFAFMTTTHDRIDYVLPDETCDPWAFSGLAQNAHPYSAMALLAGALARRFVEIEPPRRRVELGIPYDGTFFDERAAAGSVAHEVGDTLTNAWQPGRRREVSGVPPLRYFAYWPLEVRFFREKLESQAALALNLPVVPAGDYSSAARVLLAQPLAPYDRFGREAISAQAWFDRQGLRVGTASKRASVGLIAGYVDTDAERETLYRSLVRLGLRPPVPLEEFGKVWRSPDGTCMLDLERNVFTLDRPDIQALAGPLGELGDKLSGIEVNAAGAGTVWWVPWSRRGLERSLLIAALDGTCALTRRGHVGFAFLSGRRVQVEHRGHLLAALEAPRPVQVAFKAPEQDDLIACRTLYITPMRPLSNRLPIRVTVSAPPCCNVCACKADGTAFLELTVAVDARRQHLSFVTPNREDISFYLVRRDAEH
jgi:hypothetical protein